MNTNFGGERNRIMMICFLVALPLLVLSITSALRNEEQREQALNEERLAIARSVAVAVNGFLESDLAAVTAIARLPNVQNYANLQPEVVEAAIRPVFDGFPRLETLGVIGLDGWNALSITRHVPVTPRTINVSDRPYFQAAVATRQVVFSPAVLSRVRPGVPVVALAVPITTTTAPNEVIGVLVGTLSLADLRQVMTLALPDPEVQVILVDSDGQVIVAPEVDAASVRELTSIRGRPDVDAVLQGKFGSQHVQIEAEAEDFLVSFAPVPDVGWGVLLLQPERTALAPVRQEAIVSIGYLILAILFSLGLALFMASRLTQSYQALQLAREEAEAERSRAAFLAESSRELAGTLEYPITLKRIAELAIPMLADWCVVDVLEPQAKSLSRVAVAHADPGKDALARMLQEQTPQPTPSNTPPQLQLSTEPLLIEHVDDAFLKAIARDEAHLELLRRAAPCSLLVVPLRGRHGLLGAITFAMAESQRHYGQDELSLALDLADRAALAVENARLFAEVQQSVRVRDEFLAAASHDLKNPLSAVKAQVQLLARRAQRQETFPATQVSETANRIDRIVTRAAAMVDELLDVATLQLGRPLLLNIESIDLRELVSDAVAELEGTADRHNLRLEVPPEPLVGAWDGRRLRRVVDNLLSNAIKYSPDGGEVLISVANETLPAENIALLSVRDYGIGIPAADLPRLFERFRRGTNVLDRIAGTGLGLASSQSIVESHGGEITIESQEGAGTLVLVRLPRYAPPLLSGD